MRGARELLFGTGPIEWLQGLFGPHHPVPFQVLSWLGDTWGVMLVLGLTLWLFGREPFYSLVGIVVVGAVSKVGLTTLFGMPRPSGPEIVVHEHLAVGSFPSGHVYEAVGPWGLLYVLGCVPLWVPVLVGALVGVGRLYLGTHFLADVLGGAFFAVVLIAVHVRLWPHARAWLARRGGAFFVGLAAVVVAGTLVWMWVAGAHPRRYQIFGMMIAAAVGLPLEHRLLRYVPGSGSAAARVGKGVLGALGIAAFLLWYRSRIGGPIWIAAVAAGLATLWTVLGAPALFRATGLAPARPAEGEENRIGTRIAQSSGGDHEA